MAHSGFKMTKKCNTALILIFVLAFFAHAAEDQPFDKSGVLIKVDSAGLKATIVSTGRGEPSDDDISDPRAKLLAKEAALAAAYKKLVSAVSAIPPDFFPKGRYLGEGGYIRGARLSETRYYGNGSVEVDMRLDISLESRFIMMFEKAMRLAGYKLIEYDSSMREITEKEWKESVR